MASDPSPADSSFFQRWQKKFALMTGLGATDEQKTHQLQEGQHQLCEKWKAEMLNYSQY